MVYLERDQKKDNVVNTNLQMDTHDSVVLKEGMCMEVDQGGSKTGSINKLGHKN